VSVAGFWKLIGLDEILWTPGRIESFDAVKETYYQSFTNSFSRTYFISLVDFISNDLSDNTKSYNQP